MSDPSEFTNRAPKVLDSRICSAFVMLATLPLTDSATKMYRCLLASHACLARITRQPFSFCYEAMSFFGKNLEPKKIEIDPSTLTSESDQVRSRLDRIGANYEKLSEILGDLETRIEQDDRLRAINETIDEAALESTDGPSKKKRKWRPRTSKKARSGSRRKSAGPNKPR